MKKFVLTLSIFAFLILGVSRICFSDDQASLAQLKDQLNKANETIHNQQVRIQNLLSEKDRISKQGDQKKMDSLNVPNVAIQKQNAGGNIILLKQQNDELQRLLQVKNDEIERVGKKAQADKEKLIQKEDKLAQLKEESEELRKKMGSFKNNHKNTDDLIEEKDKTIAQYEQKITLITQELEQKKNILANLEQEKNEDQSKAQEDLALQNISQSDMEKIKEPLVSEISALRQRITYLEEKLNVTLDSTQSLILELENNPEFKQLDSNISTNNKL